MILNINVSKYIHIVKYVYIRSIDLFLQIKIKYYLIVYSYMK